MASCSAALSSYPIRLGSLGKEYYIDATRRPLRADRVTVPMAAGVAFSVFPKRKRTLGQCPIVIVALSSHLGADPRRQFDGVMFLGKFDFSNGQTVVVTRENIDFPGQRSARHYMADFFNDDALPKLNKSFGVHDRYGVLKLQPAKS